MLVKELRQMINKAAHAEAIRYEATEKARLLAGLEQMKKEGATHRQLREWLERRIANN